MKEKIKSIVTFDRVIKIYKCIVLTMITVLLYLILIKIPIPSPPVTQKNLKDKSVSPQDVPVVYVRDGNVTIDGGHVSISEY